MLGLFASPVLAALITAAGAIYLASIKWLADKFKNFDLKLDEHENKDQSRYEEIMHRFENVSVALARLGSTNGTYQ